MSFIDAHRARFGVEPICRTLGIAPSTYFARWETQAAVETLRRSAPRNKHGTAML